MIDRISESIFNGKHVIVPLADVQHIEKQYEIIYTAEHGVCVKKGLNYEKLYGIRVITSKSTWNYEFDCWENAIWIDEDEAQEFLSAWCRYRHELEGL